MIRTVTATEYVTPLREGGSLPAIIDGDDDGTYVVKFRGAGQGVRAPDAELQELLQKSEGLNIGLDYLPGSITFDPLVAWTIDGKSRLASSIVWFDALVSNVDRTPKNTNLLVWHRELYLIDHGATLIFHHAWDDYLQRARAPYRQLREHVLLPWATEL